MKEEFINVHCHLLNFKFVPDDFFRTRAPVREWLLRKRFTAWIAHFITFFIRKGMYNKLDQALEILDKDIDGVALELLKEMKESGIVMAVPLMMDLEAACSNMEAEVPYRYQVHFISEIARKYPGTFMPFIMMDPQRQGSADLVITALKEAGFLGVKLYPPLGYHPDPSSITNSRQVNMELEKMYEYCEKNSIPVTTHCQVGWPYSDELIKCREVVPFLTQPSSYEGVLARYPKLRINFAHFGGDMLGIEDKGSWSSKILELIRKYENVYTDLAYQIALVRENPEEYFGILKNVLNEEGVRDRIIFGTDWPMTRHTWTEKENTDAFRSGLGTDLYRKVAFENSLEFLFPGKVLPDRIAGFYALDGVKKKDLPEWMKNSLKL